MTHRRIGYQAATAALAIAFLVPAVPSPAGAAEIFEGLAGEWVGRGTGRIGPNEPAEKVYCRIVNKTSADGAIMEQSGRCAVGNTTGSIDGRIDALGGGRYGGTLRSPAMKGAATVSGTGTERRLRLTAVYEDSKSGRRISAELEFRLVRDGEYRMSTTATELDSGHKYDASDIVFRRR